MSRNILPRFAETIKAFGWIGKLNWYGGRAGSGEEVVVQWPPVPGWQYNKLSRFAAADTDTEQQIFAVVSAEDAALRSEGYDPKRGRYTSNSPPAEPARPTVENSGIGARHGSV